MSHPYRLRCTFPCRNFWRRRPALRPNVCYRPARGVGQRFELVPCIVIGFASDGIVISEFVDPSSFQEELTVSVTLREEFVKSLYGDVTEVLLA